MQDSGSQRLNSHSCVEAMLLRLLLPVASLSHSKLGWAANIHDHRCNWVTANHAIDTSPVTMIVVR